MSTTSACPACRQPLEDAEFGAVHGQVCRTGCRGIWLRADALVQLSSLGSGGGTALYAALMQREREHPREGSAHCPAGHGELTRLHHPRAEAVVIDVCETCAGCFLDPGELGAIRRASSSPPPRRPHPRRRSRSGTGYLEWFDALDLLILLD